MSPMRIATLVVSAAAVVAAFGVTAVAIATHSPSAEHAALPVWLVAALAVAGYALASVRDQMLARIGRLEQVMDGLGERILEYGDERATAASVATLRHLGTTPAGGTVSPIRPVKADGA